MAGIAEVIDQQPDSFLQDDDTHHDSQMQTMDESRIDAQQMSQDEEDHESESVRSDATTEENDGDEAMDDEEGGSPFDDENDLQDLVKDAIYRFPLGDHDT